jgi:hypothetical protein
VQWETQWSRVFVGVVSAVWLGITEMATLTALDEDHPSPEWSALAAAAVATGVVGATLPPALDLLERRPAQRAGAEEAERPSA